MKAMFRQYPVIIKSGGDIATAVAHKLSRAGFPVIITELERPMMVRRTVSFANCIYEKEWTVEGVTSVLAESPEEVQAILESDKIPVIIDPNCRIREIFKPGILVDGILAKRNCGTHKEDASVVIALGPGFTAGIDADVVIETNRGHDLGMLLFEGQAAPNTGAPGNIGGYDLERVLRSPIAGQVHTHVSIGTQVKAGDLICSVEGFPVHSQIDGVVRGLIMNGLVVKEREKLGDVDPRGDVKYCRSISDKGRNIAGAVLEAILILLNESVGEKHKDR